LRAARQRLGTAEFLLDQGYNLDAFYLGGYAIECSLKALINERTPSSRRPSILEKITQGAQWHDPEVLGGILEELRCPMPRPLLKSCIDSGWSPQLRYEAGRRDTSETVAFLKLASTVVAWTGGKIE
jgi:HEPN domain-containing protein